MHVKTYLPEYIMVLFKVYQTFIPAIQLPRLESDWLIAAPSFKRSPVAPVESARSLKHGERMYTRKYTHIGKNTTPLQMRLY